MPHTIRPFLLNKHIVSSVLGIGAFIVFFIFIAPASATAQAIKTAPPSEPDTYDFFLTVKGGISLGSYESGFNWAFVNILKQKSIETGGNKFRLLGATGASAGNINAFMTALTWNEMSSAKLHGESQNIRNNWFYNTWMPIGFDNLFPDDISCKDYYEKRIKPSFDESDFRNAIDCNPLDFDIRQLKEWKEHEKEITADTPWTAYRREDGVLTRRAFDISIKEISNRIDEKSRFIPEPQANTNTILPPPFLVGVTLTSSESAKAHLTSHSDSLEISTNHYVLPMSVKRNNDMGLIFKMQEEAFISTRNNNPNHSDPNEYKVSTQIAAGHMLFLDDPNKNISLSAKNITNAIKASSAFPGAFAPVKLDYYGCDTPDGDDNCQKKAFSLRQKQFIDGGVFDNGPLGLAVHQVRSMRTNDNLPISKNPTFVYIDPDSRRVKNTDTCSDDSLDKKGSSFYLGIGKNLIDSARQRELLAVKSQYQDAFNKGEVDFSLTRRYSPVAGSYLNAFGAFMDRSMREYDYLAGVYDAIIYLVNSNKLQKDKVNQLESIKDDWHNVALYTAGITQDKMQDKDKYVADMITWRAKLFLRLALMSADSSPKLLPFYTGVINELLDITTSGKEIKKYTDRNPDLFPLYIVFELAKRDGSVAIPRWDNVYTRLFGDKLSDYKRNDIKKVMDALFTLQERMKSCEDDSFKELIAILKELKYKDEDTCSMNQINKEKTNIAVALINYDEWEAKSGWMASLRSNQIERMEGAKWGHRLTAASLLYISHSPFLLDNFELNPGIIPNYSWDNDHSIKESIWELIPYTLGMTFGHGTGWYFGHEPRYYLTKSEDGHFSIRFPLTVFKYYNAEHFMGYAGGHFSWERPAWPIISSIHFGPEYYTTLISDNGSSLTKDIRRDGWAGSAHLGLFADKLSVGARWRDDGSWSPILLGFHDLGGLAYWAVKAFMIN